MHEINGSKGPADRVRVDVHEDYALRYWSRMFGVTQDQLKAAVTRVGVRVPDVEDELARAKKAP